MDSQNILSFQLPSAACFEFTSASSHFLLLLMSLSGWEMVTSQGFLGAGEKTVGLSTEESHDTDHLSVAVWAP